MRYLLLLLTLCGLVACTANSELPPTAPEATVASASPTAEIAVVEEATPLPDDSAAPAVDATPNADPSVELLCEVPVFPVFDASWNGEAVGCPSRFAEEGDGAYQPFENGMLVWVSESDEEPAMIYVIMNDGTWESYEDLWREGDMGRADLNPPSGFIEPERGFGLVWRDHLGGATATIGWALQTEMGTEMVAQEFGDTLALHINDQPYWLLSDGRWE